MDAEGEQVIDQMSRSYFESGYEVRSVLRTLFNSDYFKSEETRFARVKNPVELVVGAIRQAGDFQQPSLGIESLAGVCNFMGQGIMRPPSVEGWHEGEEWIESGTLIERVNFVAEELSNVNLPGIQRIIDRIAASNGATMTADELVDRCLDIIGPVEVSDDTRKVLTAHAGRQGEIDLGSREAGGDADRRVGDLLGLIGSTREFQMA